MKYVALLGVAGLGIGLLVYSLFKGKSSGSDKPLTEEEKARLGLIETARTWWLGLGNPPPPGGWPPPDPSPIPIYPTDQWVGSTPSDPKGGTEFILPLPWEMTPRTEPLFGGHPVEEIEPQPVKDFYQEILDKTVNEPFIPVLTIGELEKRFGIEPQPIQTRRGGIQWE